MKKKKKEHHSEAWDLRWAYNHGVGVANLVLPYLLIKRKQAECLQLWHSVRKRNGQYTPDELKARDDLITHVHWLNRKGKYQLE